MAVRELLFPFFAVDRHNSEPVDCSIVQAPGVDTKPVWMRARNIKGFDAADGAEKMVRCFGVELIGTQKFFP
jgi:hypothetical protein